MNALKSKLSYLIIPTNIFIFAANAHPMTNSILPLAIPGPSPIRNVIQAFALKGFFFRNIPTLIWWGIRVERLQDKEAVVVLPYSWRTRNPYHSAYFAAQAGAAELASGLLVTRACADLGPISTLVTGFSAAFVKKANQSIWFTCSQGEEIRKTALDAINNGVAASITLQVTGVYQDGTPVSISHITWSMRSKKKQV